jgi:hypothetical protein
MAGLDRTLADAALKEDYLPTIREQLHDINVILSQVEESDKHVEGRRAILSLHVGRNQGVGARAENGTLPTAGSQKYAEERVPLRYNYGRIQVSGPVIKAMASDRASYTRAVSSETKGVVKDLKRDVNRQIWGTSNGVIAVTGTTTAATLVVLAAATPLSVMRQFEVGMRIDIGTVASPTTIASDREIEAVDRANRTLEISGAAVTTSASHRIFRQGSGGDGTAQKELTGIQTIVDDSGTLFNVDPTATPVWTSYVDGNGDVDRTPTDTLIETLLDEVTIESGETPDLLIGNYGVGRAFANGLKDQKRFVNTVDLKGGFKGLSVSSTSGEAVFTTDRDAPAKKLFALNTDHLFQHSSSDWDWMDEDGAILNRVPNTDAYEATLFKYHEITTDQRNAHGVIEDLVEA